MKDDVGAQVKHFRFAATLVDKRGVAPCEEIAILMTCASHVAQT